MKGPKFGGVAAMLAAILVLGVVPAGAGSEIEPEITDPAGDANFVNGQGLLLGAEEGPDTGPLSVSGADIRAVWFETSYRVDREPDSNGRTKSVTHVPTGLVVRIRTQGSVLPTFGPTVLYRIPANLNGCSVFFRVYVRGQQPGPFDPQQRAEISKQAATCPGGTGTLFAGFKAEIFENLITLRYPFEAAGAQGILVWQSQITDPKISVTTALGAAAGTLTAPQIDEAAAGKSFVVGQDVPRDIDCTLEPDHPECEAPPN